MFLGLFLMLGNFLGKLLYGQLGGNFLLGLFFFFNNFDLLLNYGNFLNYRCNGAFLLNFGCFLLHRRNYFLRRLGLFRRH